VRIAVEGGGYGSAAGALRVGNELAAQQFGTLTQKLAGYAGMAGDDYTSREFAQQYDAAAQEAVDGLDDVVDAFATLAGLTRQSHRNHRHANQAAAYGHPAPDPDVMDFQEGTVDVGSVRLASSLGANDADVPQFWNEILDHLEGYAWPDADTGRLRDAAATWWSAADSVAGLTSSCDTAIARLETQESPEVRLAVQAVGDLRRSVSDLATEMRSVGDACEEYAAGVEEHRAIIRGIIADLAVEAGLSIVAGAVVGFFTFGGGAAAGGAIAGWRIATAAKKILTALRALHDLARIRAAARLTAVVERIGPLRSVLLRLKRGKRMRAIERAKKVRGGPGTPLDMSTRPSAAGADWEGVVARNGKGEVWQRPGAAGNSHMLRIEDPSPRYPDGCVRFYNSRGQPIDLEGDPTGHHQTHIRLNPDGTYPIPKGWNP
jgi:hypothetical protein